MKIHLPESTVWNRTNRINSDIAETAEIKSHLTIDPGVEDFDKDLENWGIAAKRAIENTLNRSVDDCSYQVLFKFSRPPEIGDKLCLPVAPVGTVTLGDLEIPTLREQNRFDRFISVIDEWTEAEELGFNVTTQWRERDSTDWISEVIKVPYMSLIGAHMRQRGMFTGKDVYLSRAIYMSLRPYIRKI